MESFPYFFILLAQVVGIFVLILMLFSIFFGEK
jgi:hypothetical protein